VVHPVWRILARTPHPVNRTARILSTVAMTLAVFAVVYPAALWVGAMWQGVILGR
jgi:hypothetical protein